MTHNTALLDPHVSTQTSQSAESIGKHSWQQHLFGAESKVMYAMCSGLTIVEQEVAVLIQLGECAACGGPMFASIKEFRDVDRLASAVKRHHVLPPPTIPAPIDLFSLSFTQH